MAEAGVVELSEDLGGGWEGTAMDFPRAWPIVKPVWVQTVAIYVVGVPMLEIRGCWVGFEDEGRWTCGRGRGGSS